MHPKLKIQLNKKLDIETCFNFINYKYGGVDFGKEIIFYHKKLKNIRKLPKIKLKKEIQKYINDFYKKKLAQLIKEINNFLTQWDKIKHIFFRYTDKILKKQNGKKANIFAIFQFFLVIPVF